MRVRMPFGVVVAAALLLGIPACGGTLTTSGEETKTAGQIYDDALSALDQQAVVHVKQTVTEAGGTTTEDLILAPDAGRATVSDPEQGVSVAVLIGGSGYLKAGDADFLMVPVDQFAQSPISTLSVHGQAKCARLERGTVTKGPVTTWNGRRAIAIKDDGKAPGGTPNTLYVALDGPPLPLGGTAIGPSTEGGPSYCGAALRSGMTATVQFEYSVGSVTITPPPIRNTPTATPAPSATATSSAAAAAAAHSPAEALALVQRIYDPYAGATVDTPVLANCFPPLEASGEVVTPFPPSSRPCPTELESVVTSDLAARLRAANTGKDAVDCAQNTPVRVSYDQPDIVGHSAIIVVHTYYQNSGDNPIKVTVDLDKLQLTDITCAP